MENVRIGQMLERRPSVTWYPCGNRRKNFKTMGINSYRGSWRQTQMLHKVKNFHHEGLKDTKVHHYDQRSPSAMEVS